MSGTDGGLRSYRARTASMAALVAFVGCLIAACAGAPPESTGGGGSNDQVTPPAADPHAARSSEAAEPAATGSDVPLPVAETPAPGPPGTEGSPAPDAPEGGGSTPEAPPVRAAPATDEGIGSGPEVAESPEAQACCGEEACHQPCESPADCPRCRPLCVRGEEGMSCVAPQREGRAECRRDADCILVDEDLPCQVCPSCPGRAPEAWSRWVWRREVRRARAECPRRRTHGARCGACRGPRAHYVPEEAICVEGACVPHGGGIVDPLGGATDPLDGF